METIYSYGGYLRKYVDETQSKGATAIICLPVPKNNWAAWKVNRADNDYGKWSEETAATMKVGFIHLNHLIAVRYDKL